MDPRREAAEKRNAEILRLWAEGRSQEEITAATGAEKSTIHRAVAKAWPKQAGNRCRYAADCRECPMYDCVMGGGTDWNGVAQEIREQLGVFYVESEARKGGPT